MVPFFMFITCGFAVCLSDFIKNGDTDDFMYLILYVASFATGILIMFFYLIFNYFGFMG